MASLRPTLPPPETDPGSAGAERRSGHDRRAVLSSADRRWFLMLLLPLAAIAVGSILVALFTVVRPPVPTVRYGEVLSPTTPPTLCPGDFVDITVPITVQTSGALVVVGQSWISADTNRRIWVEPVEWVPTIGSTAPAFTFSVQVPWTDQLGTPIPPGAYEYRRAAQELRADGSILRVPFTIREGC